MFRNLNNAIERKKDSLEKLSDKNQRIKKEAQEFLKKELGEKITGFSFFIAYNPKNESLVITTQNKTLASELTIKLVELSNFLKSRHIHLDRILIR